jgi:hypothetical protein
MNKCSSLFKNLPLAIHTKDYILTMYQNRYVMNIPILQGIQVSKEDIIELSLQDNTIYITFRKDYKEDNILK